MPRNLRFSVPITITAALSTLTACNAEQDEIRGVDRSETLLSVSATGEADMRPDEARFEAGVQNWNRDAAAASDQTGEDIAAIVTALRELGIADEDIQTSTVSVRRIDWGDRRGQFQAYNTIRVRVRDIDKAGEAVVAATGVGANVVSGPNLRLSDPEAAANSAYAAAYANARKRADAYAEAANMEVSRVLYIRDAGGSQGNKYFAGAQTTAMDAAGRLPAPPPPPPVSPPPPQSLAISNESSAAAAIMPGQTTSAVTVQVDFALREK